MLTCRDCCVRRYYDPFDPDPSRRYKMVGNFQRNDNLIPPSTSTVPGFSAGSYAPWANFSWQNYHYGTVASADGRHWHSYTDISMQIDVRADTLNNVIYDPDSKEYRLRSNELSVFSSENCEVTVTGIHHTIENRLRTRL